MGVPERSSMLERGVVVSSATCSRDSRNGRVAGLQVLSRIVVGALLLLSATSAAASDRVYFFHNDHLGTPQAMSDLAGRKVWEAEYEPFGKATVNQDPDGDGQIVINNLRFPGQYHDAETGLHYNYHRDYDPETGRYLQADPIGLVGGFNVYAYVDSNPLVAVDPLGLAKCTYSIGSHTLSCTPNAGGTASALGPGGVFSGLGPCKDKPSCADNKDLGPIRPGNYKMNRDDRPGNELHWRLEPVPKISGWKCYFGLARCGFKLHPGTLSLGCITADPNDPNTMKQYDLLHALLQSEDGANTLTVAP